MVAILITGFLLLAVIVSVSFEIYKKTGTKQADPQPLLVKKKIVSRKKSESPVIKAVAKSRTKPTVKSTAKEKPIGKSSRK